MKAQLKHGSDWGESCRGIPVLIVGGGRMAETLAPLLQRCGHPIELSASPPTHAGPEPTVVLLLCRTVSDCCGLADELHGRWPGAAVVMASDHVTIDFEDQVGLREFATLRMKSANGNEFHALVHDVLEPVPSTIPEALRPRTTDHPPSST